MTPFSFKTVIFSFFFLYTSFSLYNFGTSLLPVLNCAQVLLPMGELGFENGHLWHR